MRVYYNDSDPFVCAWLRNLIDAKLLPAGDVDERPIEHVQASDVARYTQAHFFAGIGGWPYALQLAGWGDRSVWTGSCPCQPFSAAGTRKSHADERHLWPAWFDLIRECHPVTVFGEQVSGAAGLGWLDAVALDMEALDYAVGACVLGAHSVSAPHLRQRLWFVADSADGDGGSREREYRLGPQDGGAGDGLAHAGSERREWGAERSGRQTRSTTQGPAAHPWADAEWLPCTDGKARPVEPGTFPLAHGIPQRVGRLRAYGNAINPYTAAAFVSAYMEIAPRALGIEQDIPGVGQGDG